MKEFTFLSSDGKSNVFCREWLPEEKPVAVLQIVHGMAEHTARYEAFAKYLNSFGIAVCAHDHIGHGKSAEEKDYGYFGEENGWICFIDDVEKHHQLIKEEHPDIPYYVMGHSMGSFVTRCCISKYPEGISGAIIMGTAGTNKAVGAGLGLVSFLRKIKGSRAKSKLVTSMAFGSYLKHIPDAKSSYDWLTRDEDYVKEYLKDPSCGFIFTLAGYADLFHLLGYMNSEECYEGISKDLPCFIVAGADDPVGEYGKGPKELFEKLKAHGNTVSSIKLYDGMRHEILNELGKEEPMEDVKNFILK